MNNKMSISFYWFIKYEFYQHLDVDIKKILWTEKRFAEVIIFTVFMDSQRYLNPESKEKCFHSPKMYVLQTG